MRKPDNIIAKAKRLAKTSQSWADLSNAIFGPVDGLIAKEFPDKTDRAAFRKSDAYEALHKLLEQKIKETGLAAARSRQKAVGLSCGSPRRCTWRWKRRLPPKGTSLNQLVLTKLAARLGERL